MKNITLDGVEYTPVIKQKYIRMTQTLDFEVYPHNVGEMTWNDAKKACTKLGKEWRLPTRLELILMFETKVSTFIGMGFWSSTERDENDKWWQDFDNGYQYYNDKGNTNYVHPVRDIITLPLTSGGTGATAILNTTLFGPTS